MTLVEVAHTSQLDAATLAAVRTLLDAVFDGDFDDTDWEHALGGMHVLVFADEQLVGHGAVVMRRMLHGGRALRCGYVEAIGVRADRRRQGIGGKIMDEVGRIVRGGYDLGVLGASDDGAPLYRAHGWQPLACESHALTPEGVVRTADSDDALMVLPVTVELDASEPLTCDWRDGDVW